MIAWPNNWLLCRVDCQNFSFCGKILFSYISKLLYIVRLRKIFSFSWLISDPNSIGHLAIVFYKMTLDFTRWIQQPKVKMFMNHCWWLNQSIQIHTHLWLGLMYSSCKISDHLGIYCRQLTIKFGSGVNLGIKEYSETLISWTCP